jgi:predicted PurR-regulated permease PerM
MPPYQAAGEHAAYPVGMSSTPSPVPAPVRAASEWAWRLLAIAAAVIAFTYLLGFVSEAVIPVVVATLLAALLHPVNQWLRARLGKPAPAAGITLLGTILVIGLLLFLVGSQLTGGFADMAAQVGAGLGAIKTWLQTTFHITDSQFTQYFDEAKSTLSSSEGLRASLTKAGLGASHVVAGLFISLFALFFFLYEGDRIWAWLVRLFPRSARARVDSAGHVAWGQLTAFTRATILVALVDAVGITIVALVLRVPFAPAIGALVFLGAFVPIVGALASGMIAVLIALVAQGPITALLMLAGRHRRSTDRVARAAAVPAGPSGQRPPARRHPRDHGGGGHRGDRGRARRCARGRGRQRGGQAPHRLVRRRRRHLGWPR